MKSFEILAPVGAQEQLNAAVRCGADAVYLGAGNFNARRNAENFTEGNLKQAVDYCHLRNVKVYVTLNTLVFDKELTELYETVTHIARSGADAVIVQDFAAVEAVKEICPSLPLHASTQMAVHNISGAKQLEELGFSRIVLARELSLTEIKAIRNAVKTELEVFVHGAHCMGASGNCYLSAMLGERSGNRGLCAQGCRLNWVSQHGREYALSLKDMSYLDSINELKEIGIESFKIEGRMKRPEYVAAAVTSLRKALNNESYNKEFLRSVFSRNGFTDGYLKGERNVSMFGYRSKEDVVSASGVLKELEALYKNDIHPVPASFRLTLSANQKTILKAEAEGITVIASGDEGELPRNAPLSEEIAKRSISKLGDTPFFLKEFSLENADNLTLSAASVNALRREACALLESEITRNKYNILRSQVPAIEPYSPSTPLSFRVRLQSFSQYSDELSDAQFIILPIEEIIENKEKLSCINPTVIAELPALVYPANEEKIIKMLDDIKQQDISHCSAGNIGAIKLLKDKGFTIHGTHGLNITNTIALNYYEKLGLKDVTLSFELSEKAINTLGGSLKRGAYIYGYLPLMLMRNCPQKSASGCESCSGKSYLTDRKNIQFPLLCHKKEFTTLHNSVPLYIGDRALKKLDFATLYFTIESDEECGRIFRTALRNGTLNGHKTNGLFSRELL